MNFFAAQLKWMLGNCPEFQNAKYVGRACFVPLSNGTNIKAEFVTRGTYQKYEALKLTAIDQEDGQIDSTLLEIQRLLQKPSRINRRHLYSAHLDV